MHVEQFRYSNNGHGYRKGKSPNIDQLLTADDYARLVQQPLKKGIESAITETWLDKAGIYARTYLRRVTDDLGRKGTINHTLIVTYKELAKYAVNRANLDQYLVVDDSDTPSNLPTIETEE